MLKNICTKNTTFHNFEKMQKTPKKGHFLQKKVIFHQNRQKYPIFDPFLKNGPT